MLAKLSPLFAAALAAAAFAAAASEPVRSDRSAVQRYVQQVSAGPRGEPVSRWRDPICPLVAGLSREQGELILQRLSAIAVEVGAPLGSENCRPNLYIVAAKDPRAAIRDWIARNDGMFATAGPGDLTRLIQTDRPVRVWRSAVTAGHDHVYSVQSPALYGVQTNASRPVLNWADDSRIGANVSRYIAGAAVVLDPRIDHVKLGQLADYIAMVSFAGVNQDADVEGDPTILSLFRKDAQAPAGLSPHDLAYLKALYAVAPNLVQQRVFIAEHMSGAPVQR